MSAPRLTDAEREALGEQWDTTILGDLLDAVERILAERLAAQREEIAGAMAESFADRVMWGDGTDCPDCGHELRAVNEAPGTDGYIYWCPSCRGEFPVSIRPEGMPAPIEILCAGFPCQDVSVAGGRAGLRDGTRTGLWSQVVRAITELNPRLVVLENVPGIFTASASGDVEPCPVCLGDGSGEHLRALDAVLADLAEIGFDADWTVVPASGVGAAHKRERWFCAAYGSWGYPPAGSPTCPV